MNPIKGSYCSDIMQLLCFGNRDYFVIIIICIVLMHILHLPLEVGVLCWGFNWGWNQVHLCFAFLFLILFIKLFLCNFKLVFSIYWLSFPILLFLSLSLILPSNAILLTFHVLVHLSLFISLIFICLIPSIYHILFNILTLFSSFPLLIFRFNSVIHLFICLNNQHNPSIYLFSIINSALHSIILFNLSIITLIITQPILNIIFLLYVH